MDENDARRTLNESVGDNADMKAKRELISIYRVQWSRLPRLPKGSCAVVVPPVIRCCGIYLCSLQGCSGSKGAPVATSVPSSGASQRGDTDETVEPSPSVTSAVGKAAFVPAPALSEGEHCACVAIVCGEAEVVGGP